MHYHQLNLKVLVHLLEHVQHVKIVNFAKIVHKMEVAVAFVNNSK